VDERLEEETRCRSRQQAVEPEELRVPHRRARAGESPSFLECLTYRRCGHSRRDQNKYRDKEEERLWLARDPLDLACARLLQEGVATQSDLEAVDKAAAVEVRAALDYGERAPQPQGEEALRHVFCEESP